MPETISSACDVFISHALTDSDVATEIANNLKSAGFETFRAGVVPAGSDLGEAIWDVLAESRALIAVISPDTPTHAMSLVEIGAAAAWNKPVFLLINGSSSAKLPSALTGYPVYPLNRLEDLVRAIRVGFTPFTDDQRAALAEIYRELGSSADELSQSPKALRHLTSRFNQRAGTKYSGERLLRELLRLRKTGRLPRPRARA